MDGERCWICRRSKEDLVHDMPEGFWDGQQGMFHRVEMIGGANRVERVRADDPPHHRHFVRRDTAEDEVCSFDDKRYAVVVRKRRVISVCRVCHSLELVPRPTEDRDDIPYRSIYAPGSDELTIARHWEEVRSEQRRLEAEYPDEAYRVLNVIKQLNHRAPVSLWDLSNRMNVFNHRSLEAPVAHILKQCPELGELDRRELKVRFRDPEEAPRLIQDLKRKYDRYYGEEEKPPRNENRAVLERIKKLNDPADVLPYAFRLGR